MFKNFNLANFTCHEKLSSTFLKKVIETFDLEFTSNDATSNHNLLLIFKKKI